MARPGTITKDKREVLENLWRHGHRKSEIVNLPPFLDTRGEVDQWSGSDGVWSCSKSTGLCIPMLE